MPDLVLGPGDTEVNSTDKAPAFLELIFLLGKLLELQRRDIIHNQGPA